MKMQKLLENIISHLFQRLANENKKKEGVIMKKIVKYVDRDGEEYTTKKACLRVEKMKNDIDKQLSVFNSREYNDIKFINGEYYISLTKEEYLKIKDIMFKLINKYFPNMKRNYKKDGIEFTVDSLNNYYIGRMLDDSNHYLYLYYLKYLAICPKCYKQYGQPYYCYNCSHENVAK